MKNMHLVITSIADQKHPILNLIAQETVKHDIPFILIGDTKSPKEFQINGCNFYSIERQNELDFELSKTLPYKHYARKNLGYLIAISKGAEVIIETDDDNIPLSSFWEKRTKEINAHFLENKNWVNVYKYFTDVNIWPRGFSLENIQDKLPELNKQKKTYSPIQQGLADENPDVDAIYRLIMPLPIIFNKSENIALGSNSICPFNSQNTTWFKEAFSLLYLPSYCSFRMTDIWRSFVAQRIAWSSGWSILFHNSTVKQERNEHNLMIDFQDEIEGYKNNGLIFQYLLELDIKKGPENIHHNMILCYEKLIELGFVDQKEMPLLKAWIKDISSII